MAPERRRQRKRTNSMAAATPAEQTSEQAAPGQEESHVEDAREQTPETVETPEAPADPETDVETPALESLFVLADRHRRAFLAQAALCRFMGWVDGKMVRDADYREVLNSLKNRRLGGGRMA